LTKLATNLNKLIGAQLPKPRERVWWSAGWGVTVANAPLVYFSEVIPNGSIVTAVQISTRPWGVDLAYQARIRLHLVESDRVSVAQIVLGEPVIRWDFNEVNFGWVSLGEQCDDEWLCAKTVRGAHLHYAVVAELGVAVPYFFRVSVQHQLP